MRRTSLAAVAAATFMLVPAAFAQGETNGEPDTDHQAEEQMEQSSPTLSSREAWRETRQAGRHGMMQGVSPRYHNMLLNNPRMRGLALQTLFSVMDADGDGTVSLEEAQEFMAVATERVFNGIDAENDGEITLEELRAFVQGE